MAKPPNFSYPGRLRPRPAPTAEQFAALERRLGAPLPSDYRDFLIAQNGGAPEPSHLVLDDGDGFAIECFNYLDGACEDIYDLVEASRWVTEDLGEEVAAIAGDGSGDQLILRRIGDGWRIDRWRHDEGTVTPVAATLTELLERLTPLPEPEPPPPRRRRR